MITSVRARARAPLRLSRLLRLAERRSRDGDDEATRVFCRWDFSLFDNDVTKYIRARPARGKIETPPTSSRSLDRRSAPRMSLGV